jgi:hypothetical protein
VKNLLHPHHPFRIFAISALLTIGSIIGVAVGFNIGAALIIIILIAIEIAFSFDNAIINAKTLAKLSDYWQRLFLTVGMIIAVLGMRVVFPILIVSLTAHLSWSNVLDLAFNHPHQYAEKLEHAHPAIAAYGGAFLLMLALEFFVDDRRKIVWLHYVERPLQRLSRLWAPTLISTAVLIVLALIPANHHASTTIVAGLLGIVSHIAIELFTHLFGSHQGGGSSSSKPLTGMAALSSFIYLQILDASFSFDGVIGAFAITSDVILIGIGLGIGALWVRSLTVFMVQKGTLDNYVYLEHGAHYTVAVLACVLLLSIFLNVPEVLAGIAGAGFIGSSIIASRQALAARHAATRSQGRGAGN